MYDQLLQMVTEFETLDIETTPNFRAFIMLRDELEKNGTHRDFAADVAARVDISFGEYSDEELLAIIKPFASVVNKVAEAFLANGVSREGTLEALAKQLTLKCD